jgi:glycosyltransferase involved in cell wall biosynthesis
MRPVPRLSVGLPVFNGENYLAESLDAILGQSYEDFELIISDNASLDGTADICHGYEKMDSRIRYFRQSRNIGLAPNHNFVFAQARGELFKWASYDDLYGRDLFRRCVDALDQRPDVVLVHSWTAMIDTSDTVTKAFEYTLATSSLRAPDRFVSLLFDRGGDDIYGVMRADVLRRALPHNSYHHADRTIVTELSLQGPFYQVPEWLYFRRDHPEQVERACLTKRARCANMDPRRANRLRHPTVRLDAEYIWAYVVAIRHAPLSSADKQECFRHLARWVTRRAHPGRDRCEDAVVPAQAVVSIGGVVAGREARAC